MKSFNEVINEKVDEHQEIKKLAERYKSKILGYEKQPFPSKEWRWIEHAFIDGYVLGSSTKK